MINPKKIPTHPGIVLYEEFIKPHGITAVEMAKATGLSGNRLCDIFAGRRAITAASAVRIGKYLNVDPLKIANLQTSYDCALEEITFEELRPKQEIKPNPKFVPASS
jgi:addiction module HigA family antidote